MFDEQTCLAFEIVQSWTEAKKTQAFYSQLRSLIVINSTTNKIKMDNLVS